METAEHKRFSRRYRLTRAADYQHVFKRAQRFSCAGFTILVRQNDGIAPRLGLIVSKKNAKKAVQRNRIKRQIRESFRHQRGRLANVDIIVMAKSSLATKTNPHIKNLLEKHWIRIGKCADFS